MNSYSSTQVVRLTGLTFRQLDYWDRIGFIKPSLRPASGSGTWRRYSEDDVKKLKLTHDLMGLGVSLQRIRKLGPEATLNELYAGITHLWVEHKGVKTA